MESTVPEGIDHRYSPGVAADGRIFLGGLREYKKERDRKGHARIREEHEEAQN
jgi:hypothetical protein